MKPTKLQVRFNIIDGKWEILKVIGGEGKDLKLEYSNKVQAIIEAEELAKALDIELEIKN